MSLIFVDIYGYSIENEAEKLPFHWLTLRQNLLKSSENAEFIELPAGWQLFDQKVSLLQFASDFSLSPNFTIFSNIKIHPQKSSSVIFQL